MLEAMGLKTGVDIGKLLAVRELVQRALPNDEMYGFTPSAGLPKGFIAAS
jgi:hydroxymethylglutaryl-CoA lyase